MAVENDERGSGDFDGFSQTIEERYKKRGRFLEGFKEVDEVVKIIDDIVNFYANQIAVERNIERFQYIVNQYQEQPHLLDPHLELLLGRLLGIVKSQDVPVEVINLAFKFFYFITKTRGYKVIVRLMPHEVADLEPLLAILTREKLEDTETWETKYILFIWLSIVCMIPFDMCRLDANIGHTGAEKRPIMDRIIDIAKPYLDVVDKSRDAAAYMLSRFLTRPDVKSAKLPEFIDWSLTRLKLSDVLTSTGVLKVSGTLMVLASLYKFGKREDLIEYAPTILKHLNRLQDSNNTLLRKLYMKATQRLGLTFLKARMATWRYQRGNRSLADNLTKSGEVKSVQSGEIMPSDEAEDYEIPDEIEEVIEKLLSGLKDKDTIVRWSAAKGIGRVTSRLPLVLADEVVGSVMELFSISETDAAWHGGCLALAELGRRGLILPNRLENVVPVIIRALNYDEKRANFSVGANVRDAACYVCWAFARAYDVQELAPHVKQIAQSLIIVFLFDREVNVRRAASAAFQENMGRQGSFPHGIDILTVCDYFAVGNRNKCYLELSYFVAQYEEYTLSLINHLIDVKISHWDLTLRELAAESLHQLTPLVSDYMIKTGLPLVLKKCHSPDVNTHHGALLAAAQIVHAIAKTASTNSQQISDVLEADLMRNLLLLTSEIQNAKFLKGVSGDIMKKAVCCLIEKFSLSRLPFHNDNVIDVWQCLINECLENIDPDIQAAAVSALSVFCMEYYQSPSGSSISPKCYSLLTQYVKQLDNPSEKVRCGYALALGVFPAFMLSGNLMAVLCGLVRAATILPKHEAFVETRRDAIKAITNICNTVGCKDIGTAEETLCSENINIVYEVLFSSLKDYTLDSRGDVGAWVREAAMVGLQNVTSLLSSLRPELFTKDMCQKLFCNLIQQATEKIDRTRGVAGNVFAKMLYHSPEIPYIPHQEELVKIFPREEIDDINWTVESHTFPRFSRILSFPTYTYSVLLGLTVSAGGMTESVVKHSMSCLNSYLSCIATDVAQQKLFLDCMLEVLSKHQKVDRITLCFFKMTEKLLGNSNFENYIRQNDAKFLLSLLELSKVEISRCKDVQKLLASIDVFCGLLQFSVVHKKSLSQMMVFLCHSYPVVRRNAASKIYESMITYDNIVDDAVIEEVTALLTETQWDHPVDVVRPIRNRICDLIGVAKPTLCPKK